MNILVTGAWNAEQEHLDSIRAMGHEVIWMQNEQDDLPCDAACVDGVICNGLFLYHSIERFTSLKYIQLVSAGFDRVPLDRILARGIQIHNARGVYSVPMAEFALCGVLQLYKQSRFFLSNQAENRWKKHRGLLELSGKTVCIIGCGSVGTECAKRFTALGCRVIGVDMYPKNTEGFQAVYPLHNLDEEIGECDILILTLPLTDESYHLIDASRLNRLRNGAVVVNISRGAVVDTEALLLALPRLGGAVLDVFEEEPLDERSPLWDMENAIITPHNSFVGDGSNNRLRKLILENLRNE